MSREPEYTYEDAYCGCCGRRSGEGSDPTFFWCAKCRKHVLDYGPPWEKTYYAQRGKDCPFSQKAKAMDKP